jgi:uncharacterized membrane protein YgcG
MRMPAERRAARAALLSSLGRRAEAAALHREALEEQPDDWASAVQYLDCVLPVPPPPGGEGGGMRAAAARQRPAVGFWAVAQALRGGAEPGEASVGCSGEGACAPGEAAAASDEAAAFLASLPTTAAAPGSGGGSKGGASAARGGGGGGGGGGAPLRGPAIARVELAVRRAALGLAPARAVAEAVLECYEK